MMIARSGRERALLSPEGEKIDYFLGDLCVMYNKLQVIFYKLRNTPLDDGFYRGEGVMSVVCVCDCFHRADSIML